MATLPRITKRDSPLTLAAFAEKYEALLVEALAIAQRKTKRKRKIVQDVLASATVEGLAKGLNAKAAAINYRAEKYKRTWHTLIAWRYLDHTTAAEEAASMISHVEDYVQMTETDSWPKSQALEGDTEGTR